MSVLQTLDVPKATISRRFYVEAAMRARVKEASVATHVESGAEIFPQLLPVKKKVKSKKKNELGRRLLLPMMYDERPASHTHTPMGQPQGDKGATWRLSSERTARAWCEGERSRVVFIRFKKCSESSSNEVHEWSNRQRLGRHAFSSFSHNKYKYSTVVRSCTYEVTSGSLVFHL